MRDACLPEGLSPPPDQPGQTHQEEQEAKAEGESVTGRSVGQFQPLAHALSFSGRHPVSAGDLRAEQVIKIPPGGQQ